MSTKKDFAARLATAGITLPGNWSKLSTARAEEWMTTELAARGNSRRRPGMSALISSAGGLIGAALGRHAKAAEIVLDTSGPVPEAPKVAVSKPSAMGKTQSNATMPKDPKWRRNVQRLRKTQWFRTKPAPDPEPMTRQVRRQNERRVDRDAFFGLPNAKHLRYMNSDDRYTNAA